MQPYMLALEEAKVAFIIGSGEPNQKTNQRPLCHAWLLLADGAHTLATFIDSGESDR